MNTLHTRLQSLRLESGLTQEQVSRRIGLSQPSVCSNESGRTMPNISTLISFARLYHCTTDYLLGLSNVRKGIVIDTNGLSPEDIRHIMYIINRMKNST